MEALLKTEDNISPHLCVLRRGGKVTGVLVVGDTVADVHVTKGRVTCGLGWHCTMYLTWHCTMYLT